MLQIYNGSSGTGGGTRYMLNNGSGSFIFDLENRIDTPPQGIRNIYASDLNDDGNFKMEQLDCQILLKFTDMTII